MFIGVKKVVDIFSKTCIIKAIKGTTTEEREHAKRKTHQRKLDSRT